MASQAYSPPYSPITSLITGHFRESSRYWARRPQGTSDWLIIYTLTGRGRFGHRGGQFIACPGDMVLLKPGTPHDYGVEPELQRWELLWSHFVPRAHWLEWLDWPELATGLMHLHIPAGPLRRRLSRCFHEADRLVGAAPAQRHKFAMHALEEVILLCDQVNPRTCEAHLDDRVREAMEFMGQNLKRKVSLEEIADAAGLSVSRLSWLFRKHAAASPMQYMEAQRLDRAQRLLELTNLSVKEISRRVGFDSPFYFSLRFKRHTGLSPRTYRLGKGDLSKGALPDHDQKRI